MKLCLKLDNCNQHRERPENDESEVCNSLEIIARGVRIERNKRRHEPNMTP